MRIIILILIIVSCKTTNTLRWQQKGINIDRDTIRVEVFKDSNRIDTIRYAKHTYYRSKSPKVIKGHWYVVAAVIIGAAVVVLLRR